MEKEKKRRRSEQQIIGAGAERPRFLKEAARDSKRGKESGGTRGEVATRMRIADETADKLTKDMCSSAERPAEREEAAERERGEDADADIARLEVRARRDWKKVEVRARAAPDRVIAELDHVVRRRPPMRGIKDRS